MRLLFAFALIGAMALAALALARGDGDNAWTRGAEGEAVTGIPQLDALILTQHRGQNPFLSRARYGWAICGYSEGFRDNPIVQNPQCIEDEEPGTPVEVLPVFNCAIENYRRQDIEEYSLVSEHDLYAVYPDNGRFPALGGYVLIFEMPATDGAAVATSLIVDEDGYILAVDHGCSLITPKQVVERRGLTDAVLAPER